MNKSIIYCKFLLPLGEGEKRKCNSFKKTLDEGICVSKFVICNLLFATFIWCLLLGNCDLSNAALQELGIYPLKLEGGAHLLAMGSAGVGLADDVNAALYNPGALPYVKGISVSLKDLGNLTAAQAYPTGFGQSFGIAFITQDSKNISYSGNGIANYSGSKIIVSAATKLKSLPIGIGANLKGIVGQVLRRTTFPRDISSSAIEYDLGIFCKANDWVNLGVCAENIASGGNKGQPGQIDWDDNTSENIPASLKFGIGLKPIGDLRSPIYVEDNGLQIACDYDYSYSRQSADLFHLGAEWQLRRNFVFRLGFGEAPRAATVKARYFSVGAGFRTTDWGLDLAYRSNGEIRNESEVCFSLLYFPREWVFEYRPSAEAVGDAPNLKINTPDNLVVYDEFIEISGQTDKNAAVQVNSMGVFVDSKGLFRALVPLRSGKNYIAIDAIQNNAKTSASRKVLRKAKVIIPKQAEVKKEIKDKVENLITLGVIEVAKDKPFEIEAKITRGELANWLVKGANLPLPEITQAPFADVPTNYPYAPHIKLITDLGVMRAFADGTFKPNQGVSEKEGKEIFKKFGIIR